jgi:hypothetical protein
MAQLVIGAGSSHGPTLQSTPEDWNRLGESDQKDKRYDYQALLRRARPGLDAEIAIEKQRERHAANEAGLATLQERLTAAELDVLVVISNPHRVWADDNQPVFGVFRGAEFPVRERRGRQYDPATLMRLRERGTAAVAQRSEEELTTFPGEPQLAEHLISSLIGESFDVGMTDKIREGSALDEAFTLVYERFYPEGALRMVPFMLSRYLPHQPLPSRCYDMGAALGRAIRSWDSDARVGVLASGGLSHQIIDEDLDHQVIDALVSGDGDALRALDRDRLNGAPGTPEILNWVAVAGALSPANMTLVDYVPCYRSLAGTGHGITFGYWE